MNTLVCKTCEKLLPLGHKFPLRYCDSACKAAGKKGPKAYPGVSTATSGAISELRVCSDLLRRGYEVFRAVSPSCSCDLAVLVNKQQLFRIEVRTVSYVKKNGELSKIINGSHGNQDIYAWVTADTIIYEPDFPAVTAP